MIDTLLQYNSNGLAMTKKSNEQEVTPYKPYPYQDGNKVIRTYTEEFMDSVGNTATITKCDFTNKKGKLQEGYDLHVSWHPEEQWSHEKQKCFMRDFYNCEQEHLDWYDGPISYFFTHENKLFFAYLGMDYNDYFAFELKTMDRFDISPFKNYEEVAAYLKTVTRNYFRITEKRYIDSPSILKGIKAELSFDRFIND